MKINNKTHAFEHGAFTLRWAYLVLSFIYFWASPSLAINPSSNDPHYGAYLNALQNTPGALTAISDLGGAIIEPTGVPNLFAVEWVLGQLVDASGNPTLAYTNPTQAAQNWIHADAYLQDLRQNPFSLNSFNATTGQTLPANGPLTASQYQFLFSQMSNADGSPTLAYTNPTAAVLTTSPSTKNPHYSAYLNSLQNTPGALTAISNLGGVVIEPTGVPNLFASEWILGQVWDINGNPKLAYNNPTQATQDWIHADAYLQALRSTPGALDAISSKYGQTISPLGGPLTAVQIDLMFSLMSNPDGSPTLAYTNPTAAAQTLAQSTTTPSSTTTTTKTTTNTAELALGIGLLLALGVGLWYAVSSGMLLLSDILPLAWLGIGAVAVLALFLIFNSHKTENQTLGAGDAPVLPSTSTVSASQIAQTTPPTTSPVTNPQVQPIFSSNSGVTIQTPSQMGTASITTNAPVVGSNPFVIGTDAPNQAYKSFYLTNHQDPTGLSANPKAVAAMAQQKSGLTLANNPGVSASKDNAALESAATSDKNVTSISQSQ